MGLANCRGCGDLFHTFSGRLECPACLQQEREHLDLVRRYVRTSDERSIEVIAAETGIDSSQILKWLRSKRLALDVVPGELRCYRCNCGIKVGRFCDDCQRDLVEQIARERASRGKNPFGSDLDDKPRGYVRGRREAGPTPPLHPEPKEVAAPPPGMHLRG